MLQWRACRWSVLGQPLSQLLPLPARSERLGSPQGNTQRGYTEELIRKKGRMMRSQQGKNIIPSTWKFPQNKRVYSLVAYAHVRSPWSLSNFQLKMGARNGLTFYTCIKQTYTHYAPGTRHLRHTVAQMGSSELHLISMLCSMLFSVLGCFKVKGVSDGFWTSTKISVNDFNKCSVLLIY